MNLVGLNLGSLSQKNTSYGAFTREYARRN